MDNAINKKESQLFYIFIIFAFIITPFVAILFNAIYLLINRNYSDRNFNLLIVLIALYFGLINSTKLPESDLVNYKEYFHSAAEFGFFEYLLRYEFFTTKEPIFYIFTYALNKVLLDSYELYILTTTSVIYYLSLKSFYKYWNYHDGRVQIILFSIVSFAFFYIIFSSSSHLIRQMLAGSIFVYYLTNKIVDNKNNYLLPLLAVLIHNSSIFLFMLTLIPGVEKKFKIKKSILKVITLIISVILLLVFVSTYSDLVYNIPVLGGIAMRVFEFEAQSDTRAFVVDYSLLARYVVPISLMVVSFLIYKSRSIFQLNNYSYINIFILFSVFVEILFQLGLDFIAVRLNYYVYFFIPIIITHFFSFFKSDDALRIVYPIQALIVVVLFVSWVWFLSYSQWTYAPLLELFLYPVIFFFL